MNEKFTLKTVGHNARHLIFSFLSARDTTNINRTCKEFKIDYDKEVRVDLNKKPISFLEDLIERRIVEKILPLYPFLLQLDENEKYLDYLFKGLDLDQKKLIFKVLSRCINYINDNRNVSDLSLAEKIKLQKKQGQDLYQLLKPLLDTKNLLNLIPLEINNNVSLSDDTIMKLTQISPILIMVTDLINKFANLKENHFFSFQLMYATEGKEIYTLQRLIQAAGPGLTFLNIWQLSSKTYLFEKLIKLFNSKYQLTLNSNDPHFSKVIYLFGQCNFLNFNKVFSVLLEKFNRNIASIVELSPYLYYLLDSKKAHEWIDLYSEIELKELMGTIYLVCILGSIDRKHHEYLKLNPSFFNQIKSFLLLGENQDTRQNGLRNFGIFLNHYFGEVGVQKTLELKHINSFFRIICQNSNQQAFLSLLCKFKLAALNYFPEDMIAQAPWILENYFKLLGKQESTKELFYQILYYKLWPSMGTALTMYKLSELEQTTQAYLNTTLPNLNMWTYDRFSKLDINFLKYISPELLNRLEPIKIELLDLMIKHLGKNNLNVQNNKILHFMNYQPHWPLIENLMNQVRLDRNCINMPLKCLHYLATTEIKGKGLLAYLSYNRDFINAVIIHKLITFLPNGTVQIVGLDHLIESGVFQFIQHYPTVLKKWMDYIFPDNFNKKIDDLGKVINIIGNSKHKGRFMSLSPHFLCSLLESDPNLPQTRLEKLLVQKTHQQFVKEVGKIDKEAAKVFSRNNSQESNYTCGKKRPLKQGKDEIPETIKQDEKRPRI